MAGSEQEQGQKQERMCAPCRTELPAGWPWVAEEARRFLFAGETREQAVFGSLVYQPPPSDPWAVRDEADGNADAGALDPDAVAAW